MGKPRGAKGTTDGRPSNANGDGRVEATPLPRDATPVAEVLAGGEHAGRAVRRLLEAHSRVERGALVLDLPFERARALLTSFDAAAEAADQRKSRAAPSFSICEWSQRHGRSEVDAALGTSLSGASQESGS